MRELETPRLRFRKFTPGDLQDLAAVRADADVMRYIGCGRPESLVEVQLILDTVLTHWNEHGFGPWALIEKPGNTLIGWCGLCYLENTRDVEIAYGIAKQYWRQGLASEAAAATIKYGFEQLHLDRIVAVAWPDNLISRRLMEKLRLKYAKQANFYNAEVVYYAISREDYQMQA